MLYFRSKKQMTTQQINKVLSAIKAMEKACLSSDSKRTTAADIRANGLDETRDYFQWLRLQAPMTAMGYDDFNTLIGAV